MPLAEEVRQQVVNFITRDLVPEKQWPGSTPMEWFRHQFDFMDNETLSSHLAEAYYQARFAEKLRAALGLKGGFNKTFIKTQVILYASIYEAVIDYFLECRTDDPIVGRLVAAEEYVPATNAFAQNTQLTISTEYGCESLTPCRRKVRRMKLKEIQFNRRVEAAESLGLVLPQHSEMIKQLYTSRNRIHLTAAAAEDFKPDAGQTSEAFRSLRAFLDRARRKLGAP